MKKVCWFDTETTGLNAYKNDVIQLACIIEIDKKEVAKQEFFMRPFDFDTIEPKALAVNGRTVEELKTFPNPKEALGDIQEFLGEYVDKYAKGDKFHPAGYNVSFDIDFLKNFWRKCGDTFFGSWFNYKAIDPMQFLHSLDARGILSLSSYKLVDVCKFFDIPLGNAHNALADIEATKKLMDFLGSCFSFDAEILCEGGYGKLCKRRGQSSVETLADR